MTAFEQMAADLERVAGAPSRVATRAAPGVLTVVHSEFAHGKIRGLTDTATARADGPAVVLTFDDRLPVEALHADPLPASWKAPIDAAIAAEAGS